MPYFTVMTGLRGGYMPDSAWICHVSTRRELRAVVDQEARYILDGDPSHNGLSQRAVSAFAAEAWRRRKDVAWVLDLALPYGPGTSRPYGIFLSRATRRDFNAYENEEM